jgi:hypothetical protein
MNTVQTCESYIDTPLLQTHKSYSYFTLLYSQYVVQVQIKIIKVRNLLP